MTETLKSPRCGIDIVDSPDDGGFYLQTWNLDTAEEKVSEIYPTREAAVQAMSQNAVRWERI